MIEERSGFHSKIRFDDAEGIYSQQTPTMSYALEAIPAGKGRISVATRPN
jgi:hypothetical protein